MSDALRASQPPWAKAAIVAELEHDDCDSMTDYFATTTSRRVLLGWSRHTRDLFPELRQAAARFPETAHLGPGCGVFTVRIVAAVDYRDQQGWAHYKGEFSHWHSDLLPDFAGGGLNHGKVFDRRAEAEAWIKGQPPPEPMRMGADGDLVTFEWEINETKIEHREKYSMGHGYYLKASGRYGSGWRVCKWALQAGRLLDLAGLEEAPATTGAIETRTPSAVTVPTLTRNEDHDGIELRFPEKPSEDIRATLKAGGWRWSRFASCWYHRDTPQARALAAGFIGEAEAEPEAPPEAAEAGA